MAVVRGLVGLEMAELTAVAEMQENSAPTYKETANNFA
jgi:hypothetical protein